MPPSRIRRVIDARVTGTSVSAAVPLAAIPPHTTHHDSSVSHHAAHGAARRADESTHQETNTSSNSFCALRQRPGHDYRTDTAVNESVTASSHVHTAHEGSTPHGWVTREATFASASSSSLPPKPTKTMRGRVIVGNCDTVTLDTEATLASASTLTSRAHKGLDATTTHHTPVTEFQDAVHNGQSAHGNAPNPFDACHDASSNTTTGQIHRRDDRLQGDAAVMTTSRRANGHAVVHTSLSADMPTARTHDEIAHAQRATTPTGAALSIKPRIAASSWRRMALARASAAAAASTTRRDEIGDDVIRFDTSGHRDDDDDDIRSSSSNSSDNDEEAAVPSSSFDDDSSASSCTSLSSLCEDGAIRAESSLRRGKRSRSDDAVAEEYLTREEAALLSSEEAESDAHDDASNVEDEEEESRACGGSASRADVLHRETAECGGASYFAHALPTGKTTSSPSDSAAMTSDTSRPTRVGHVVFQTHLPARLGAADSAKPVTYSSSSWSDPHKHNNRDSAEKQTATTKAECASHQCSQDNDEKRAHDSKCVLQESDVCGAADTRCHHTLLGLNRPATITGPCGIVGLGMGELLVGGFCLGNRQLTLWSRAQRVVLQPLVPSSRTTAARPPRRRCLDDTDFHVDTRALPVRPCDDAKSAMETVTAWLPSHVAHMANHNARNKATHYTNTHANNTNDHISNNSDIITNEVNNKSSVNHDGDANTLEKDDTTATSQKGVFDEVGAHGNKKQRRPARPHCSTDADVEAVYHPEAVFGEVDWNWVYDTLAAWQLGLGKAALSAMTVVLVIQPCPDTERRHTHTRRHHSCAVGSEDTQNHRAMREAGLMRPHYLSRHRHPRAPQEVVWVPAFLARHAEPLFTLPRHLDEAHRVRGGGGGGPALGWGAALPSTGKSSNGSGSSGNVTMVVGSQGVGKSTLCRLLANAVLSHEGVCLWLDLDLGQPEFGVPGQMALFRLHSPLLRPHERHAVTPVRSYFLGQLTPSCPRATAQALAEMCEWVRELSRQHRWGVVVNTHGWVLSTGRRTTLEAMRRLQPRHVIHLLRPEEEDWLSETSAVRVGEETCAGLNSHVVAQRFLVRGRVEDGGGRFRRVGVLPYPDAVTRVCSYSSSSSTGAKGGERGVGASERKRRRTKGRKLRACGHEDTDTQQQQQQQQHHGHNSWNSGDEEEDRPLATQSRDEKVQGRHNGNKSGNRAPNDTRGSRASASSLTTTSSAPVSLGRWSGQIYTIRVRHEDARRHRRPRASSHTGTAASLTGSQARQARWQEYLAPLLHYYHHENSLLDAHASGNGGGDEAMGEETTTTLLCAPLHQLRAIVLVDLDEKRSAYDSSNSNSNSSNDVREAPISPARLAATLEHSVVAVQFGRVARARRDTTADAHATMNAGPRVMALASMPTGFEVSCYGYVESTEEELLGRGARGSTVYAAGAGAHASEEGVAHGVSNRTRTRTRTRAVSGATVHATNICRATMMSSASRAAGEAKNLAVEQPCSSSSLCGMGSIAIRVPLPPSTVRTMLDTEQGAVGISIAHSEALRLDTAFMEQYPHV